MAMQKLVFHWDIHSFVDCDLVKDEFFDSPRFFITDFTFKSDWKLRMYPAGFKHRENLSIILLRSGSTFHTKHSISFLNRNGNRIETISCSKLCIPMKFTDSETEIMEASNIVEIKKNAQSFTDGGVLSVLCELEIFEKNEEIEAAVPKKQSQMRGTSWVIQNKHHPTELTVVKSSTFFYIPYGNLTLRMLMHGGSENLRLKLVSYQGISKVPITIDLDGIKSTWNITRHPACQTVMHDGENYSLKISTRCMVDSTSHASPVDITPCARKMQKDFRNIFSKSEGGDISIAVDERVLHVHKNILSGRCPVFAAMFDQEWREKTTQTITIKKFDYKTILALIEYIYFGGCDDDNDEEDAANPVELLKAAHMYQLDDLSNKCEHLLCERLNENNVVSYILLAETYDLLKLKKKAFTFIKTTDL